MVTTSELLRTVDWDFKTIPSNRGIHAIHPYPARFIPEIARYLIKFFHPKDDSVVLDPFCGSGTTLVEAIIQGYDAWGVDLNPLACQISRVKTRPITTKLPEIAREVVTQAKKNIKLVQVPEIPRLDHWFKPDIQNTIASLISEINELESEEVKEALQVALSSIIVRVSNQESDTRYAAIEKSITGVDTYNYFQKAVNNLNKSLSEVRCNLLKRVGKANIINRDILEIKPSQLPKTVGLVVTSPPYPNAYEYWLYHKYRMYWLGMDPISVREKEIGARPHYHKKDPQNETDFEEQMSQSFKLLSKIMLPNAKACFVVGRSIIRGRIIDNKAILERAGSAHGFTVDGIIERNILSTRKTFNPAHGKINKEHLIIFTLG